MSSSNYIDLSLLSLILFEYSVLVYSPNFILSIRRSILPTYVPYRLPSHNDFPLAYWTCNDFILSWFIATCYHYSPRMPNEISADHLWRSSFTEDFYSDRDIWESSHFWLSASFVQTRKTENTARHNFLQTILFYYLVILKLYWLHRCMRFFHLSCCSISSVC